MYLSVPVAGVGMIVFELEQVFQHVEELVVPAEAMQKEEQ